jgi:hypothetical protein
LRATVNTNKPDQKGVPPRYPLSIVNTFLHNQEVLAYRQVYSNSVE